MTGTAPPPLYTMRLSLSVLDHLGLNLYSNIPAVLSDVVAVVSAALEGRA
jgi:hypothetical protein